MTKTTKPMTDKKKKYLKCFIQDPYLPCGWSQEKIDEVLEFQRLEKKRLAKLKQDAR